MKDNLSMVILMILLVLVMIMFPLYNYFERQDDMSYSLVLKATTNFAQEVMNNGYLDQNMYDNYINQLTDTGNLYDIELEAHRKILVKDPDNADAYIEKSYIDYNEQIFSSVANNASSNVENLKTVSSKSLKNNIYKFDEGDEFYVKVKNSSTTMAGAIFNALFKSSSKDRIVVNYGGIIKNDSWAKVDASYNAKEEYSSDLEYSTESGSGSSGSAASGKKDDYDEIIVYNVKKDYTITIEYTDSASIYSLTTDTQYCYFSSNTKATYKMYKTDDIKIRGKNLKITITDDKGKVVTLDKVELDELKFTAYNDNYNLDNTQLSFFNDKQQIIRIKFTNVTTDYNIKVDYNGKVSAKFQKSTGSSETIIYQDNIGRSKTFKESIRENGILILQGDDVKISITDYFGKDVKLTPEPRKTVNFAAIKTPATNVSVGNNNTLLSIRTCSGRLYSTDKGDYKVMVNVLNGGSGYLYDASGRVLQSNGGTNKSFILNLHSNQYIMFSGNYLTVTVLDEEGNLVKINNL